MRTVASWALIALFLSGCISQGADFDSKIDWIKKGQTTQHDVKLILNEPFSVGQASETKTWTYGFYKYRLFGKSYVKELKLYWYPDNTLKRFSFSSSFPEDTKSAEKVSGATKD